MVLAHDAALADAVATATANRVQSVKDIQSALGFISGIPGIVGAVAIKDDQLGAWGEIELCRL